MEGIAALAARVSQIEQLVAGTQGQYASQWNLVLAYLTIAMIPAIILFIAGQKYIVAGLTGGAIKG